MKIKACPYCKNVLVCAKCGNRFTPERSKTTAAATYLSDVEREELKKVAKKHGMTLAAYLRFLITAGKVKNEDNPGSGGDTPEKRTE